MVLQASLTNYKLLEGELGYEIQYASHCPYMFTLSEAVRRVHPSPI